MDDDIFRYLARLEVMVFFAGYAIIYALVYFLVSEFRKKPRSVISLLKELLPYGYAVSATVFLGFTVRKVYTGYEIGAETILYHPFLVIWGLTALLFWFRPIRKFPVLSLIHSLVFFVYIPRDIILSFSADQGSDLVKNDMSILTGSLLLNATCLFTVVIIRHLFRNAGGRQALNKRQV